MINQNKGPAVNSSKPCILIVFLSCGILELIVGIVLLVLLTVYDNMGFGVSSGISQSGSVPNFSCPSNYLGMKYSINAKQINIMTSFVASIMVVLFAFVILIVSLKILISPKQTSQFRENLSIYLDSVVIIVLYICQSLLLLGSIHIFGIYCNFVVEALQQCEFEGENQTSIFVILSVCGFILGVTLIGEAIMMCICWQYRRQLDQLSVKKKYSKKETKKIEIYQEDTMNNLKQDETKQQQQVEKQISIDLGGHRMKDGQISARQIDDSYQQRNDEHWQTPVRKLYDIDEPPKKSHIDFRSSSQKPQIAHENSYWIKQPDTQRNTRNLQYKKKNLRKIFNRQQFQSTMKQLVQSNHPQNHEDRIENPTSNNLGVYFTALSSANPSRTRRQYLNKQL